MILSCRPKRQGEEDISLPEMQKRCGNNNLQNYLQLGMHLPQSRTGRLALQRALDTMTADTCYITNCELRCMPTERVRELFVCLDVSETGDNTDDNTNPSCTDVEGLQVVRIDLHRVCENADVLVRIAAGRVIVVACSRGNCANHVFTILSLMNIPSVVLRAGVSGLAEECDCTQVDSEAWRAIPTSLNHVPLIYTRDND